MKTVSAILTNLALATVITFGTFAIASAVSDNVVGQQSEPLRIKEVYLPPGSEETQDVYGLATDGTIWWTRKDWGQWHAFPTKKFYPRRETNTN